MYRFRSAIALVAILTLHAGLVARMLDDELLLNPDESEYLIGARSLATGHGYVDLSQPDHPVLPRPPGTSLLLVPIVGMRGYDITACKVLMIAMSLVSLSLTFLLTLCAAGLRWGALVGALLAMSPVTLFHDGRVQVRVADAVVRQVRP